MEIGEMVLFPAVRDAVHKAEGKPVTVTNPDMTRFIMTIEEALDLVLYAFENGKTGDMSGTPVEGIPLFLLRRVRLFLEITVVETLQSLSVASLVASHFMNSVVNCIQIQSLGTFG